MDTSAQTPAVIIVPGGEADGRASPALSEASTVHAPLSESSALLRERYHAAMIASGSRPDPPPVDSSAAVAGPSGSGSRSTPQFAVNQGASTSGLSRPVRPPAPADDDDDYSTDASGSDPEDAREDTGWATSAYVDMRVALASGLDELETLQAEIASARSLLTDLNTDSEVSIREANDHRLRVQELDRQITRMTTRAEEAERKARDAEAAEAESQAALAEVRVALAQAREELAQEQSSLQMLTEERNDTGELVCLSW